MNIYPIISTVAACLFFSSGLYILIANGKSAVNRLFFLACSSLSLWSFFATFVYSAGDLNTLLFFYPIAGFGFHFYFAFNLHFCIRLTKIKLHYLFYVLLYLFPFIFFLMAVYDHRVYVDFIREGNKWVFLFKRGSVWLRSYLVYQFATILLSVLFLWMWKSKTESKKTKKISLILIAANLFTYPLAILGTMVSRIFFFHKPQGETPFYFLIWILCSLYVILRYYFLSLTPELVSSYLMSNINESVVLLDNDLKIIFINKKTKDLIGESKEGILHKDLSHLAVKTDLVKKEIEKMLNNAYNDFSCRMHFKSTNEPVLMDVKFSKFYDKHDDLLGILIIGSEVKEAGQLKLFYKLTDREIEIVQLMIQGLSNKEIGAAVNLTENTIKSHVMHVFNKLNVSSRVEMINLLTEYNLIPRSGAQKKILLIQ
jgi:DNA-binding CsgD family transcriptional regulator